MTVVKLIPYRKYLVTDFEPSSKKINNAKFDYIGTQVNQPKCESNPELNVYIKKPQFSRDLNDYDVTRKGYTPRKLVCDEGSSYEKGSQSKYWLTDCEDVPTLSSVVTVIGHNLTQRAMARIKELGLIISDSAKLSTPYALVINDQLDFEKDDANLWRMIREAEKQNADLVLGSWRNEKGQWSSSCLHYNLQKYTLHIWDGYYKSIGSMKYCDMGLGPVLVRKEHFDTKLASLNIANRIDYHLRRPDSRVINCLDCMFYQSDSDKLSKEILEPLAHTYSLNSINYLDTKFEFTCIEAGIKCDRWFYHKSGLAEPPCCLRALTGMMMLVQSSFVKSNKTTCIYNGQVLAALKMPGGQLPWEVDLDMPMPTADFDFVKANIITLSLLSKYGLTAERKIRARIPDLPKEVEDGFKIKHPVSQFTMDHNAIGLNNLLCGHQSADYNRTSTKILLDGIWVSAPDNPGSYARLYGDEYLRHVPWVSSTNNIYSYKVAKFQDCINKPTHACLDAFQADGNIQFRDDFIGLPV